MKKLFFFCAAMLVLVLAQAQVNTYTTTGSEIKLTGVLLEDSINATQIPRATFWFNFSEYFHFDVAESFGFFVGIGIENIGYIAQYNDSLNTKAKYRSYMATMPIGFKVGNFDKDNPTFFFAGGAVSLPFHFKKRFFMTIKKILFLRNGSAAVPIFSSHRHLSGLHFRIK